jgi:hypothetical protein
VIVKLTHWIAQSTTFDTALAIFSSVDVSTAATSFAFTTKATVPAGQTYIPSHFKSTVTDSLLFLAKSKSDTIIASSLIVTFQASLLFTYAFTFANNSSISTSATAQPAFNVSFKLRVNPFIFDFAVVVIFTEAKSFSESPAVISFFFVTVTLVVPTL